MLEPPRELAPLLELPALVVLAPDAEAVALPDVNPASLEVTEPVPHAAVHVRDAATRAKAADCFSTTATSQSMRIDRIARAPAIL